MGLLEELAVRCEAALPWEVDNSPHFHNMRALDLEVARAVGWDSAIGHGRGDRYGVPAYTASVDAAMTLIPKDEEWSLHKVLYDNKGCPAAIVNLELPEVLAATPALALTAASLRARHALALSQGAEG